METSRLHIVYLIARFHPFNGGAEENCMQMAKRMAAKGHRVSVLTTDASPRHEILPAKEKLMGIEITRVHRWNQQLNLGFYPALLPVLLRMDADVIHVCNGPGFIWHEFCLFWKKIFSRHTKFINTPHGPFLATPTTHSGLKYWVARVGRVVMWPYYRILWPLLFDLVVAVNPHQTKWLSNNYGIRAAKTVLVPNGIDRNYIQPRVPSKKLPLTITFLGRIEKYKGVLQLTAAARLLSQTTQKRFQVLIMGRPGPVYQELLQQIKTNQLTDIVRIINTPTDQERDTILIQQSQIMVLPSEWEATGIVLLQAMATGNAIIATSGNELAPDLIKSGANGYVYDFHDVAKLSEMLKVLVENDPLRLQMQMENLKRIQNYTWDNVFNTYLVAVARLCKN